ncbi:MAG: hypothetical protein Q4G19_04590 [Clostridia bacterium]|nr:hypothetical protein [Clostridia bacterium]
MSTKIIKFLLQQQTDAGDIAGKSNFIKNNGYIALHAMLNMVCNMAEIPLNK